MQLKKVNHYFEAYKGFLKSAKALDRLYIWESQKIFQENWDLEATNFADMYDLSLQNSQTRRLWKRENYEPKHIMSLFIDLQLDYVLYMFKDLFKEEKSIEGRVDRFVFYCDQLLQDYKQSHPRSIENNHYHDDNYQMISLYLAFRFPDQYTYFDAEGFKILLQKLGSTDIPKTNDFGRFCKVVRTLNKLMAKDAEILELHQKRLLPNHYQEESLLLIYDFYQFCAYQAK